MLLEEIKEDKVLFPFLAKQCEENNVRLVVDKKISGKRHIVIKVDDYYNSFKIKNRPKSPDCLILHKCYDTGYGIAIVELKKRRRLSDLPPIDDIIQKFKTCLNDFMLNKFKIYFDRKFERIELYYVINRNIHPNNIDIGLNIESIMEEKIKFKGKFCIIRPCSNNQKIKACYKKNK